MMRTSRLGSSMLVRLSSRSVIVPRRSFAATAAIRQPDMVSDLYLKGLKEYKTPAEKPSDADGHVQKFTPPAAPKSPEETNLANDIQSYETAPVEIEGQAVEGGSAQPEDNYFEDLKVFDEEPAHH